VTLEQILFNPGHICSPGSLRILQVSRRCWGVFAAQRTNLANQRSNVSSWSRIALSFSRSGSQSAHRGQRSPIWSSALRIPQADAIGRIQDVDGCESPPVFENGRALILDWTGVHFKLAGPCVKDGRMSEHVTARALIDRLRGTCNSRGAGVSLACCREVGN